MQAPQGHGGGRMQTDILATERIDTGAGHPGSAARRLSRRQPGRFSMWVIAGVLTVAGLNYFLMRGLLQYTPPALTDALSRSRARDSARRASTRVPAYREFLGQRSVSVRRSMPFSHLPETERELHPRFPAYRTLRGRKGAPPRQHLPRDISVCGRVTFCVLTATY